MVKEVKFLELEIGQRQYIDRYATAVDLYLSSKDEYEHERARVEIFVSLEVILFIGTLSDELDPERNMIYSVARKKFYDYLDSL